MLQHEAGRLFPFAPDTAGSDFIVLLLGDLVPRAVDGQHPVALHLVCNHRVHGAEIPVVGRGDKHLVEFVVHPVQLVGGKVFAEELPGVAGIDLVGDAVAVLEHGGRLQQAADLEELPDIVHGNPVDPDAFFRHDGYKILLLQAADRIPHRRAAGVQLLAEHVLRQQGTGQDFTGDDFALEGFVRDLFQRKVLTHRDSPFSGFHLYKSCMISGLL